MTTRAPGATVPGSGGGGEAPDENALLRHLSAALAARTGLLDADPRHETGVRLFNGFLEGWPELTVEVYGRTLVIHNYSDPPDRLQLSTADLQSFYLGRLPWLNSILVKARYARTPDERRGVVSFGAALDTRLDEAGVRYALDLRLNQDTSFYLDARGLRAWARQNLAGKTVLNAFAYTGSLGVAALAGGAARVVHLDRSRAFLNVAKESYTLNGFPIHKADFIVGDFFERIGRLKWEGARFDCVMLDPPLFSSTARGTVDLVNESGRLINKVRPQIADGGWLAAVNNALFVSGAAYLSVLERLCADGYLTIEALIAVPGDCAGYPETVARALPADPVPFNHATKIAILRVRRKSP